MWPGLPHLKQIVEFDDGFELERFGRDDREAAIASVGLEYGGRSWGTEQSRGLELSRDNNSGGSLLEFEFADCLLRVLLECDDDIVSVTSTRVYRVRLITRGE